MGLKEDVQKELNLVNDLFKFKQIDNLYKFCLVDDRVHTLKIFKDHNGFDCFIKSVFLRNNSGKVLLQFNKEGKRNNE